MSLLIFKGLDPIRIQGFSLSCYREQLITVSKSKTKLEHGSLLPQYQAHW
jgi:hypothetical protein